jgi:hypothetical protein
MLASTKAPAFVFPLHHVPSLLSTLCAYSIGRYFFCAIAIPVTAIPPNLLQFSVSFHHVLPLSSLVSDLEARLCIRLEDLSRVLCSSFISYLLLM